MNSDALERLQDILTEAMERPPQERAAFLDGACGDDAALRAEAGSLLDQPSVAGAFLETPAYSLIEGDLGNPQAGELKAGDELGGFCIVSLLGEGGMGEVYLAQDTKLERRVAVKLLKRRLDDASLARRFRHERKVLAALTHPNIARLYDGGITPEGRSYLVMEYVEGERLDHYCERQGLSIDERLTLFRKVCAAVSYAHQNLVVHRDLKPANIRVTPEGEPKLLDFGIAKLLDPEGVGTHVDPTVTLSGAMTPEYASPEQLKGEKITTVSDVYSLGVILYELLCGQRPYTSLKSRRLDELVRAICEQEPPRPSTVAGHAPPTTVTETVSARQVPATRERPAALRRRLEGDLDNIVAKALRNEPARRYPNVLALSEDLRRHCEGLPVTARKDTLRYRAGKFVRRNRVSVAAAALVTLALLVGFVVAIWQAKLARQERDRARLALANAETAQRQSELARKQTQRINEFLQKVFTSANPDKMGKDATIAEVLDAASGAVDQTLANEPEVLAEIHRTLSLTYQNLGLQAASEKHCRAALALYTRLYGADDDRTLKAEVSLGFQLSHQSHYEEAVPFMRHVVGQLRHHPKGNEKALATALATLGFCSGQLHNFSEAEQALDESAALYDSLSGKESMDYAIAIGQFGSLKQDEGDLDAAAGFFRRELAILSRIAPDVTPVVIGELNLCGCLIEAGKFTEAETLLETLKRDCRRIVGENNNFLYTNVLFDSELLDFQRGNFAKVAEGGKAVLDRFSAYSPKDELDSVTTNYLLGASLTRVGRATDGEPYLRTALANFNPVKGAYFLVYGNAETALGDCLLAQKRDAEAETLLLTGHDDLEKRLGPQNRLTIQATHRLHDLYTAWNKPDQAARFVGADANLPAVQSP